MYITEILVNLFPGAIYLLFLVGFFLLIKGADLLVDGGVALARRLNISELVIGLTIISFGTSMPELVVNVLASLENSHSLAIGNIIGSNIANILLILGVSATIRSIKVKSSTVTNELPLSIVAVFILAILANDRYFVRESPSLLSRGDGLVLLTFFGIFIYYSLGIARLHPGTQPNEDSGATTRLFPAIVSILAGLLFLFLGGEWIVKGAVHIARQVGVGEMFIGLTVVALGTSLPELAASVMAVLKNKGDLAIGNVVGSNIFNIFWILGVSSLINPIPFGAESNSDLLVAFIAGVILFAFFYLGRYHELERYQGAVLTFFYVVYVIVLIFMAGQQSMKAIP